VLERVCVAWWWLFVCFAGILASCIC